MTGEVLTGLYEPLLIAPCNRKQLNYDETNNVCFQGQEASTVQQATPRLLLAAFDVQRPKRSVP